MEINLSVPTYDQGSNLTVETRPRQVKEWLDSLPLANTLDAARTINDALASLNRYKLGDEARLKLLELYHATLVNLLPALEHSFSGVSLPLPEKSKQAANMARQLLVELAYGYKIIFLESISRRIGFGGNKQLPLIVQRALLCLSQILSICYKTYAPTPAGIWSELHQLYHYAIQHNLQDEDVPGMDQKASINLAYKQALLLALADPYRLMQGELELVQHYLAQFGNHAQLQPLAQADSTAGLFLVRLDGDKPPKALAQNTGVTDARSDILLNTIGLARLLHQQIVSLEAKEKPKNLNLPDNAAEAAYQSLLKRLLKHWGVGPKRHFNRTAVQSSMNICAGIRSLHYFMLGEKLPAVQAEPEAQETDITLQFSSSLIDKSGQQTYSPPTKWWVVNESAGGLALSKLQDAPSNIRVGEIIGLRAENSAGWSVGVVRWIHSSDTHHLELGAQMLAPKAEPVAIKPTIASQNTPFQAAFLLPDIPTLKQPATLVAPRGTFQEQREFLLEHNGESQPVRATRLVEHTNSFDLFEFSPS